MRCEYFDLPDLLQSYFFYLILGHVIFSLPFHLFCLLVIIFLFNIHRLTFQTFLLSCLSLFFHILFTCYLFDLTLTLNFCYMGLIFVHPLLLLYRFFGLGQFPFPDLLTVISISVFDSSAPYDFDEIMCPSKLSLLESGHFPLEFI